jgi:Cysteine-rich CPXCG
LGSEEGGSLAGNEPAMVSSSAASRIRFSSAGEWSWWSRLIAGILHACSPACDLESCLARAFVDDLFPVTCPYCGEEVEIYVEPDVRGSFVQDCEVCCNPWTISVSREGDELFVEVSRADGTD